jgi:uncharacterized UPF0160 family protein
MNYPDSLREITKERKARIITHSGSFHADEILGCAVLALLMERDNIPYEIIRTRDTAVIEAADIALDVGGIYDHARGRYDHHQQGGAGDRGGVPYSSFGLIWRHFGMELSNGDPYIWDEVERHFCFPVDMGDNAVSVYKSTHPGLHPFLFHHLVFAFRPTWKEREVCVDTDPGFIEVLDIAKKFLAREIRVLKDRKEGYRIVEEEYRASNDKKIVLLTRPLPWEEVLARYPEPLFAVYPNACDGAEERWCVQAVRSDVDAFENRATLPLAWRGLMNHELEKVSGIAGALFCHRTGFFGSANSKDGALKMAHAALLARST